MAKNEQFDLGINFSEALEDLKKKTLIGESLLFKKPELIDQEPEIVEQPNKLTAPQFNIKPVDFRPLGQKIVDTGSRLINRIVGGFEEAVGSISRRASVSLRDMNEQRRLLEEEANKLAGKDRQKFQLEHGLVFADTSGIREYLAKRFDDLSAGSQIILRNNQDLLPNPKFAEQPLSENIKDPEFWAEGIGSLIPNLIGTVAVGVGTAVLTKNPVAVGTALFGTSYSLEAGQAFDDAKNFGLPDEEALRLSNYVGIANGALDILLPSKVVGNVADPLKKSVTKKMINAFLVNPTIESSTETMQQVISNAVRQSYDENASLLDGLAESAIFGAIGGVIGGGIEAGQAPSARLEAPKLGLSIEDISGKGSPEEKLTNLRNDLSITEDMIKDHPALSLEKYARKTGELPEIVGGKTKSLFAKRGDEILDELGFQDERSADRALVELRKLREHRNRLNEAIKEVSKESKIIQKKVSAVEKKEQMAAAAQKKEVIKIIKGKEEPTKKITRPEDVLLREKMRTQERAAKLGYKAGVLQERADITNKLQTAAATAVVSPIEKGVSARISEERAGELAALKDRILTREEESIRDRIVKHARESLPPASRGKFLKMAAESKTYKNLVKAFVRINQEVDNVAKKSIIADLKSDIERITNAQNIAIDIKKRILSLFKGIDLTKRTANTLETLQATRDFIARKKNEGEDVAMPERILDKLQLLAMNPASEMSLAELEALRDDLLLLEHLGKTKLKAREEIYEAEKSKRAERIAETAIPLELRELNEKPIGESLLAGEKLANLMTKALNKASEKNIVLTPMDGVAEITGMQEMKARHDLNYSNYHVYKQTLHNPAIEFVLENNLDNNSLERIGVWGLAQQEGGLEKLANNGITEEDVNSIELTPTEMEFYQKFMREKIDALYPVVKEYARVNYNVDVGQVDNYVSFITDHEAMSDIPVHERFGPLADNAIANRKNVRKGFLEERTGAGKQRVKINALEIYLRHTDDVAYMLNMGRDIKMDAELLKTPEMREALGNLGQLTWVEWLDLMARKGGTDQSKTIQIIDTLRKNVAAGILSFRLTSALVQLTAITNGASVIGGTYAFEGGSKIATSKEWRKFIKDNFPEIMATVGDDPSYVDLDQSWLGKAAKVGITPLVKLDMLTRSSVAVGAYIKTMNEKGLDIDLTNPNKEAIAEAQRIVRQTQGSSLFKDQPLAISKGLLTGNKSVDKMLLSLQSFVLSNWDNIRSTIWRQGFKKGDYKKAISGIVWLFFISTLMEMGLRRGAKELINLFTGDDEEDRNIVEGLTRETISKIPIIGQLAGAIQYGSNPIPLVDTMQKTLLGAKGQRGFAEETTARATGAAALAGVPGSTQIGDIINEMLKSTGASDSGGLDLNLDLDLGIDLGLDLGLEL